MPFTYSIDSLHTNIQIALEGCTWNALCSFLCRMRGSHHMRRHDGYGMRDAGYGIRTSDIVVSSRRPVMRFQLLQ